MYLDSASLDIIVRSVALSAFVETPRDATIIAGQGSGGSSLAAAAKAARNGVNGGMRMLGRGLALFAARLGRVAEAARPGGRCPA